MKKIILILSLSMLFLLPINASASGLGGEFYPYSDSKYFNKKITWGLYSSSNVDRIQFLQFDSKNKQRGKKVFKVKPNSITWFDFSCPDEVAIQFLNKQGQIVDSVGRGQAYEYISIKACSYKSFVKISNYDPKKRDYKK